MSPRFSFSLNKTQNKGFTLLEVLIVVAIIGIISVLFLAYIDASKKKASNTGVKSNVANARVQAEVYFNGSATSTSSYTGMCNDATNGIVKKVQAATQSGGFVPRVTYLNTQATNEGPGRSREVCHALGSRYVVWVPFDGSRSGSPRGWCIDSTNFTGEVNANIAAGDYTCQ